MSENTTEEIKTAEEKKNIRKAYIFLSFIPFAILMAVQSATVLPGLILSMLEMDRKGIPMEMASMLEIFNQNYAIYSYIIYCVISIAVLLPWYYRGFVKKNPKVDYKKAFGFKPVVLIVLILICLYLVLCGMFAIADKTLPSVMQKYYYLMKLSSIGTNMLVTIVYGYMLGPVAEELAFRGLIFCMLEKAKLHYMLVILIQGLLFGIMHMNPVQSVYAFLIGVTFGYLRYKYKTVILSIGAHIVFNILGTSVEIFLEEKGFSDMQRLIFAAVAAVMLVVLFIVVSKDKCSYLKENKDADTAS